MPNVISTLLRCAAWGMLLAVLLLTVVPAGARPILVRGHYMEHLLAFGSLGAAFAIAYRQQTMASLFGLTCFSVAIEIAQLFLPTRHARWQDLVVDVFAVCAGVVVVRILQKASTAPPACETEP